MPTSGSAASAQSPALPHLWLQRPLSYSVLWQIFLWKFADKSLRTTALIWGYLILSGLNNSGSMLWVVFPPITKLKVIQLFFFFLLVFVSHLQGLTKVILYIHLLVLYIHKQRLQALNLQNDKCCLFLRGDAFIPALSSVQHHCEQTNQHHFSSQFLLLVSILIICVDSHIE